jgi:hypothetical protein
MCPEAVDDFWGFPTQQDEIRHINHKVPGEGFSDLIETDIQEYLKFHATELIEEKVQQIIPLSESEYEGKNCCCAETSADYQWSEN